MEPKDRLKYAREKYKLTQAEFGQPLGLSAANVRDLESGKVRIATIHALAIESAHGIPAQWLMGVHDFGGPIIGSTGDKPIPHELVTENSLHYPLSETLGAAGMTGEVEEGFVKVPRYEVEASAGGGAMIHSEQIVDHLSFKADWVHNALGVSVKDLALIHVTGDSMEPTLSEGDLILIDMSHRGMKDNAIYVLQLNGALLVKRLQHKLDGSVIVKSDNASKYEPETVTNEGTEALNIIGRVVWCGRRM